MSFADWNQPNTIREAEQIQRELSKKLILCPFDFSQASLFAGVDVSYIGEEALGIVVVINKNFELLEVVWDRQLVTFPYIPGFLAFREAPVVLKCFEKLKIMPDIVLFDGQGIAHPRRLGIASHVGVILDIPTIGVAKGILYGQCNNPKMVGQATELVSQNGEKIGYCLLSKTHAKPIIVSPGHRTDVNSSLLVVKALLNGYKLPEPVRLSHYYSQKLKK